ncbi:MAG: rhodanese-like domain-containing protein, partial [Pseudomonadota bacterium]|nr:rhodanese-like domain-containing protein [Pseudomonadota bacterium]
MSQGLFASLFETGRPFCLIDSRERRDHVDGHWFGSTNIPLSVLTTRIQILVPDRHFPIHLLDWQDAASEAAAWRLSELGYADVILCPTEHPREFGNGFVKGEYVWSKAFGEVVAHGCGLPEVTPATYLESRGDALLFDVRPTAEYREFTIPASQSLPNSLLLANMDALKDTGRTALLHCAGRTRSIIGACTLKAAGYDGPFAIFRGGTQAWQLDGH